MGTAPEAIELLAWVQSRDCTLAAGAPPDGILVAVRNLAKSKGVNKNG